MGHTVGFEFKKKVEMLHGRAFKIDGLVGRGERIEPSPPFLNQTGKFSFAVGRRSPEHEVLKQMGNACNTRSLIARADLVPDLKGGDRRPMVFQYDDGQPVVEDVLCHLPAARVDGLAMAGLKADQEDECANERRKESQQLSPCNHSGHSCERQTCLQGEGGSEREGHRLGIRVEP